IPPVGITDVLVFADPTTGAVRVNATLYNAGGLTAAVEIFAPDGNRVAGWHALKSIDRIEVELHVKDAQLWSPEQPALYRAIITLEGKPHGIVAKISRTFGFRQLTRDGEALLLNNTPVCLRGVLNWGWYPEILCPAPDEKTIRDEFRRVRSAGYNMV